MYCPPLLDQFFFSFSCLDDMHKYVTFKIFTHNLVVLINMDLHETYICSGYYVILVCSTARFKNFGEHELFIFTLLQFSYFTIYAYLQISNGLVNMLGMIAYQATSCCPSKFARHDSFHQEGRWQELE